MSSARLPGKSMLPVLGRPLLWYNLERIRAARAIETVVVATSTDPGDDEIAQACEAWQVPIFRGSLDDVLDRNYRCAISFGWEVFAKFTADNPLIDPAVIDAVIAAFHQAPQALDFFSNNHPPTWQDGQEIEVLRTSALEQAWREADRPHEREHVTPFLWDQPERFRVGNLSRPGEEWHERFRWTLDYPEDFELIRKIFEALYPRLGVFSTADIMALYERCPELYGVNCAHAGKNWYAGRAAEMRTVAP